MTDKEFERACEYLARRFGLDMRSKRVLLECRLSREREGLGLSSFSNYLDLIESGADPEAADRFADLVTTHYTYFMRESKQLDSLLQTVFPELERVHPHRTWNILCAGCSTGDECYTVSMLVEDYGRTHSIPPVRIIGIDVSEPALDEARRAIYTASHVEKVPPRWLSAYFEQDGEAYAVVERIRKRVSFICANLRDLDAINRTYDLILCRNVIIYFNDQMRQQVLAMLHRHLAPSGFLALGHAEILRDRTLFSFRGDSLYQKQREATSL